MSDNILVSILLFSPLFFFIIALLSALPTLFSIRFLKKITNAAAIFYFIISIYAAYLVYQNGLMETNFIGYKSIGISFRLDTIAVCMFVMVAFLSYIIVKFSGNYLDGDKRQGLFFGRLAATIAAVQLLIISGNIGILFISWVLTSIFLNKLLIYYPDRILAKIAAHKKFIVARLADFALFLALILLYATFETGNLEELFQKTDLLFTQGMIPFSIQLASCMLAIAALLKSAQFPTHGWLTEVMETPTPVSALLHAGLLNAGPFLIIRMAFIFETSQLASILLILIGGFTALFASSVYLTQTSIKTALAYSSVAHMGFSLFLCGIGFYSAAMLHMVAHSFYKAHAFLSSGSLFENDVNRNDILIKRDITQIVFAYLSTITVIVLLLGFIKIYYQASDAILILTAVVLLGLSRLVLEAYLRNHSAQVVILTLLSICMIWIAFSYGELFAHIIFADALPMETSLNWMQMSGAILILMGFAAAILIQSIFPLLQKNERFVQFSVHLKNGFYANTIFDKLIGALKTRKDLNNYPQQTNF